MNSFICETNSGEFMIRHYTPDGVEDRICGHATLAAVELLVYLGKIEQRAEIKIKLNPIFNINSKHAFDVSISNKNITIRLPIVKDLHPVLDDDFYRKVSSFLSVSMSKVVKPAYFSPLIKNFIVGLEDEVTLLDVQPDFVKIKEFRLYSNEGFMLTAPSTTKTFDIVSRVFQPFLGVNEDAACGSANCLMIPYWINKREGCYPEDKSTFRVLFPVNPYGHQEGFGGLQSVKILPGRKEIEVTGQAQYMKPIFFNSRLNPF